MHRLFFVFFTLVVTIILTVWVLVGTTIYRAYNNPESIGEYMGKIERGYEKGRGQ
jgi:hypothetical protein